MREFWRREGLIEIHTPKLMGSASESGAELFKVEYFERTAYLAQSAAVLQADGDGRGLRQGVRDRARVSREPVVHLRATTRSSRASTSSCRGSTPHEDVMAFEETWLAHVLGAVRDAHGEAIEAAFATELVVPSLPFPRVTLEEAKWSCCAPPVTMPSGPEHDLDPPSERALVGADPGRSTGTSSCS